MKKKANSNPDKKKMKTTGKKKDTARKKGWEKLVKRGVRILNSYNKTTKRLESEKNWELGDLAQTVEKDYGSDSIGKYAREIGVNKKTLEQYRWVSRKFEKTMRLEFLDLPWSHFMAVAELDEPKPWLKKARDNKWSYKQLVEEIKASKKASNPGSGAEDSQTPPKPPAEEGETQIEKEPPGKEEESGEDREEVEIPSMPPQEPSLLPEETNSDEKVGEEEKERLEGTEFPQLLWSAQDALNQALTSARKHKCFKAEERLEKAHQIVEEIAKDLISEEMVGV